MIEREFVSEKIKHLKIKEIIDSKIRNYAGVGNIEIEKTPLGEKIVIHTERPSLVIGRGGETIKDITSTIKKNFNLENPRIEVKEIVNPFLSAQVVAKRMVADLERFGSNRFKIIGHKAVQSIMRAGAMGVEIRMSGRGLPGARAKSWRFYDGYLKKCGDTSLTLVDTAKLAAHLRMTTVGVQVKIMPPGAVLPDRVNVKPKPKVEEIRVELPALKAVEAAKPSEAVAIKPEAPEEKKTKAKPKKEKPEAAPKKTKAAKSDKKTKDSKPVKVEGTKTEEVK